jgi:putative ABC transport system permease protein
MRLTSIAFGHLRRGKARAALVVAGLALGVATAVALANVTGALERHLGEELDRYGANIVVAPRTDDLDVSYGGVSVSGVSYAYERLKMADIDAIRSIDYAERLAVVAPVLIGAADAGGRRTPVAGIDVEETTQLKRWWRVVGRVPASPDEVLVGYEAALALGVLEGPPADAVGGTGLPSRPVGDVVIEEMDHTGHITPEMAANVPRVDTLKRETVTLGGRDFRVAGVLDATGSADDRLVFMDLARVQEILERPGEVSLVEVSALCIECPVEMMVHQIQQNLPGARVTAVQQAVKTRSMTIARLARFGAALAGVVLVVAALLVFVTMTASVAERRREIGVLRAVGFRRSHILKILGLETAVLGAIGGLAGWAAGLAAGSVAARYFTEGAVTGVHVDPLPAMLAVAGSIMLGVLGALYPALKASKLDPTEALRYV